MQRSHTPSFPDIDNFVRERESLCVSDRERGTSIWTMIELALKCEIGVV